MDTGTPFHEGEQAVQTQMGVREQIEPWARQVVRPFMPEQHRAFYAQLPFVVAAAQDTEGRVWATLLAGKPGFARAPTRQQLSIDARPALGDALEGHLRPGTALGLLGIDFATRRRNRLNGRVRTATDSQLVVDVNQTFGNCPQYIGAREWEPKPVGSGRLVERFEKATAMIRAWVESADTFFVASGYQGAGGRDPRYGMDASHRGGDPGFVRFIDDRRLVWADYAGNNHYNTLGNLFMDPRVGLLFVDFERGNLLQISGHATIDWGQETDGPTASAQRLVTVHIDAMVILRDTLPLRWKFTAGSVRSLRVVDKRAESEDVVSLLLTARDGGELPDFEPGQHLPIEVQIAGLPQPATRTYSLSKSPDRQWYRITVKRDANGLVSRALHDQVSPGDFLNARAPAGDFVLRPGSRPVVLVSAGVGLTPMVSMLEALEAEKGSRQAWFVYGARDGRHHPLATEVRALIEANEHLHLAVAYSRPDQNDVEGREFDYRGRVDGDRLAAWLPTLDADFYLCGPVPFMAQIRQGLESRGVDPAQIQHETFGSIASAG